MTARTVPVPTATIHLAAAVLPCYCYLRLLVLLLAEEQQQLATPLLVLRRLLIRALLLLLLPRYCHYYHY